MSARATKASKSSNVPRSGWIASWPPSLEPIAHGEPGSSGPGVEGVVGALAVDLADRVDRRQVDDVEAHRGDGVEPLGGGLEGAAGDLAGLGVLRRALGAREELVPAAEERLGAVGVRRVGALDGEQLADRVARERPRSSCGVLQGGEPRRRRALRCPTAASIAPSMTWAASAAPGSFGSSEAQHPLEQQPALGEHQLDVDAGADLDRPASCCQVPSGSTRPAISKVHAPGGVRGHPGLVEVGDLGVLGHPHRGAAYAVGVGEHDLGAELVVALAEHARRDGNGSPTVALAGCRPRSTSGVTFMTGMRPTMRSNLARMRRRTCKSRCRRLRRTRRSTLKPSVEQCVALNLARDRLAASLLDRSKDLALPSVWCVPSDDSPSVPCCPPPLAALGDLAGNLRWSWHPETQDVFAAVDPDAVGVDRARPGPAARRRRPRPARASWRGDAGVPGRARAPRTADLDGAT